MGDNRFCYHPPLYVKVTKINMTSLEERKIDFLTRAQKIHKNKFSYEKYVYVNARTRSTIICLKHGEFEQAPYKHLITTYPCPKCLLEHKSDERKGKSFPHFRREQISKEEYLKRLNLPSKYEIDLSNYVSITHGTVTLTCPEHGSKVMEPRNVLISKYKCPGCGWEHTASLKRKGYESFIEALKKVHGNKYTPINPEEYIDRKSILTFLCKEHGEFKKKAQKLLSGQPCQRCTIDRLIIEGKLTGGYDERLFREKPEIALQPATVYYLKVGNTYKIGITRNNLNGRLRNIRHQSKKEVTLLQTFDCSLKEAYLTEQYILNKFANVRTIRRWSTEVFSENVLAKASIKDLYNEMN